MARKDESLQQPRPFVYIFCPDRAFSATKTAGTRDPEYVQQDHELELRASNAAGCTLGHIWRGGGKGKTHRRCGFFLDKKPRHNLSHRCHNRPPPISCSDFGRAGAAPPSKIQQDCSQGERQRRCYHAITRRSTSGDGERTTMNLRKNTFHK